MDPTKRITSKDALQDDYFIKEPPRPSAELVNICSQLNDSFQSYVAPKLSPINYQAC